MADPVFVTIAQHWNHFLERDVPSEASEAQVEAMKIAFCSGAISGLQLTVRAASQSDPHKRRADIEAHLEGIKTLGKLGE